jgi:4-hydroxy-tetrahydrodipicolinate synthase
MQFLPTGIWPVMLTPFNENKSIDAESLKSLIDFYIEAGASGLFAACGSSEIHKLDPAEILQICRTTIKHVNKKLPVAAGALCAGSIANQVEFIKRVAQTGPDAVVIMTNQIAFCDSSESEYKKAIEELVNGTGDIRLGIYECPIPYPRLLSPELIKFIAETGRFTFHKDTCCNIDQIALKLNNIRNTPLHFYNANINTLVESLRLGGHGFCGIASNFYPEILKWLFEHFNSDIESVKEVENFIIQSENLLGVNYPWSAKYFLNLRGIKMNTVCRVKDFEYQDADAMILNSLWEKTQDIMRILYN